MIAAVIPLLTLMVPVAAGAQAATDRIASALRLNMNLTYESQGAAQPPWVVQTLRTDSTHRGRSGCAFVHFSTQRLQGWCASGDTLFQLRDSVWVPARPIAPNRTITLMSASGARVVFETGSATRRMIGNQQLLAIETTVTTYENGVPVRRLREQFAPAILTALGGTFEQADPAVPGGWRTTVQFTLRGIE